MSHKLVSLYIGDGEYYTRTDADKVIAELKAQKAQAEDDCAYWKMQEGNAANAMRETEEYAMQLYNELRHQKYKRCLAMADYAMYHHYRMLEIYGRSLDNDRAVFKINYGLRWRWRWLALAEKFKPNKEAK